MEQYINKLKELTTSFAPSGREDMIYSKVCGIFSDIGEIEKGNMNNIFIHKKGAKKAKIAIMAHVDEVFLMITDILDNGFLKFKGRGIDVKTLVSQEVIIYGKEIVRGVIGIKPPHLMSAEDRNKAVKVEDLMIDTGFSKEELKSKISIGDCATINRDFIRLLNNNVCCKALDDRAGVISMYICGNELKNKIHDLNVDFICSCQEEVGVLGAKISANKSKPDIAIAVDVTFDSGMYGANDRENKLGSGPAICVGPNIHSKLKDKLIDVAIENNIPYQVEVEPGSTGTDAWDIQVTNEGIPTLLISIPIKYMHTSVEVANMEDIKNTGKLMARFIESLSEDGLEDLLCF